MKNQFLKKFVSVVLSIGLVFSITACSNTDDEETKVNGQSKIQAEDGPLTPYEEPVEITWGVQASAVQQFFNGDTYDDNVWSRLIKEKLNIDLKVEFSADTSTDAYNNKVKMQLASGEFPDVFRYSDRVFFQEAQEAGYLADITDVFDEYATDKVKEFKVKYADSFEGASIDDRLYAFPYMTDNFHQAVNLWIRDDWMENTNSQAPKTVDELVELARKFTFEDPDGNGVDDTYGFALSKSVTATNFGTILGLVGAYGVPGYGTNGVFYKGDDGKITFPYIDPAMKDALAVVKGMYDDGIIDPEFITKDINALETDVTNGKVGMMYHMCWGDWHPFNLSYQKDSVITRPYPIPEVEGIDTKMGVQSNQMGELFMISADCKNPEALIKILNLYEETVLSSSNPDDFNTYWANEQYRFSPIFIGIPVELHAPVLLEALEKGSSEGLTGTVLEYYNYVEGFEDGSLADDTNAYGTWGQMAAEGSMKLDLDAKEKGQLVTDLMANEIPETWQQNSSILGTMVETTFTDIIIGNKPIEYFDTFVEEWLKAGGQETLEALEEIYK